MNAVHVLPEVRNEAILNYTRGSAESAALNEQLQTLKSNVAEIPSVAGAREYRGGRVSKVKAPHQHEKVLAQLHEATPEAIEAAVNSARDTHADWSRWSFEDRAAIFLKAADLLAGPWRQRLNAATMLGQSKSVYQAEIDSACELIDFLRFNVAFAQRIYAEQPISSPLTWNQLDYRPLEGFVYAVTPFNFTAIGGNLAVAPALMGNTVVWKPAATATLSNYLFFKLLQEAGLPPGVINFVPGDAVQISASVLAHQDLGGIHFTGSTAVFNSLWRNTAERLESYRNYPRLVGETGGKDFVLAHPSADLQALAVALLRGAYEYQGQKCSAASRAYIPKSLWSRLKPLLLDMIAGIKMGDVSEFDTFMGAVIDAKAFTRIKRYVDEARQRSGVSILAGGQCDDTVGYFVAPTLIEVSDARDVLMREEIFGPVLTVYVYEDSQWRDVLKLVDSTCPYALTGAVFAQERDALREANDALRYAAGNYYINDKPTGAVVGQQPFGGARASGTNDKAGSALNLLRWTSPRTLKENFTPPHQFRYPHMA
ncbi:MAG: L-glutamate gamma-semialdehyde dehydrogenase [bacterium]